ncbi:Endonuclease III [bioreactor metagenome]|jgi:endonuclease-3|uniref:Endonuclease III n=1 Tax=bioreactor metagenome TaxID=1076179 RepID=A0A644VMK7_9ZZZZ|nr:endonuclease III [Aminivibrio sp.]MEA4953011.1 endonuclease III [Aminivibrio sp.]NCB15156.1 endonuclease III [Synergistales bacterium]
MGKSSFSRPAAIDKVFDGLEKMWGNESAPPDLAHDEPLDGLVLTLLSQNTNDRNRDRAFAALKVRFPEWEAAAAAASEDIAECIRPAGLARTKSERMLRILDMIRKSFGGYSLRDLKSWEGAKVREYLSSLPGIGAKTIACVMLFDLGKPAFPVDTHIARFCRRMEWVPEKTAPEDIQGLLEEWVPQERFYGGHINIIEHGRGICGARKPDCSRCLIAPLCPYNEKNGALS